MTATRILGCIAVLYGFFMSWFPSIAPSEFAHAPHWAVRIFASIIVLTGWLFIVVSAIIDKLDAMHREQRDRVRPGDVF